MTVAEFSPSQRKSKKVLARLWVLVYSYFSRHAGLAQLVARHLAKVEVAGSSPVCRSELTICNVFFCADQLCGCGFVTVQKGDSTVLISERGKNRIEIICSTMLY